MKLAIIGVSGFVGGFILSEAVTRGHHVTGIVRNPEKMKPQQNCTVVKGDVYNERELSLLLSGHDAVVSAFNPGWGNPSIRELFIKGSRSIINATKASGVRRLVFVGGAGSLEVNPGVQLVDSPEFPAEYKEGALGAREALSIIKKEHTLDWTFVSPSIVLKPGERTGHFRIGGDSPLYDDKGESTISTQDLAMAIINEIENPEHIRKRITVGY